MILDKKPASTPGRKNPSFCDFLLAKPGKILLAFHSYPQKKALAILNYAEI
ncbi:TPA: hypothetical protein R4229_002562 [Morganella morganii]|jgi:hypothetical protein|nr:hypothetical protein [Morganella morganii]